METRRADSNSLAGFQIKYKLRAVGLADGNVILYRKSAPVIVAITSIALVLMSCSLTSCTKPSDSQRLRILSRGIQGTPETLDPHQFTSTQAGHVIRDLYEGLVALSPDGKLVPGVAERWEISSDGLEYLFYIRDDARWSNGAQISAHHVVFSFRRLVSPKTTSNSATNLSAISNAAAVINGTRPESDLAVRAISENVLSIRLDAPTPYFLQLLSHPSAVVLYPPGVADYGDKFTRPENFVGNGAYMLTSREFENVMELRRNDRYWDDKNTWFDQVTYHVVEPLQEVTRYRAGDLDITSGVDSTLFARLLRERPDELKVAPFVGIYYYGFNMTDPVVGKNKELRQALSMAIDREAIVDFVTKRGEKPAFGWVPAGISNYESQVLPYSEMSDIDRERKALELFGEAGYTPGDELELEIRYNTIGGHELIAVAIQSMWNDVLGVKATLIKEEFKVFLANVRNRSNTQIFRLSWTGDFDDATTFLQLFQSSNPSNLTGYSNGLVDKLLDEAEDETDPKSRQKILQEVERESLSDHPVIPLYFFVSKHLVRPDIAGWRSNLFDVHYSKDLRRQEFH